MPARLVELRTLLRESRRLPRTAATKSCLNVSESAVAILLATRIQTRPRMKTIARQDLVLMFDRL